MSPTTHGEPNMALAESCQRDALKDLQIGSITALTAFVSWAIAALEVYPNATVPIAILAWTVSVPFFKNGIDNIRLARKHRDGISVPG